MYYSLQELGEWLEKQWMWRDRLVISERMRYMEYCGERKEQTESVSGVEGWEVGVEIDCRLESPGRREKERASP